MAQPDNNAQTRLLDRMINNWKYAVLALIRYLSSKGMRDLSLVVKKQVHAFECAPMSTTGECQEIALDGLYTRLLYTIPCNLRLAGYSIKLTNQVFKQSKVMYSNVQVSSSVVATVTRRERNELDKILATPLQAQMASD